MTDRTEAAILNDALIAGSAEPATMIWRNNTGQAWVGTPVRAMTGQMIKVEPGMKILRNARPIQMGTLGSGDVLGVSHGRAIAGEAKTVTGQLRVSQINFRTAWERAGGLYIPFRSPEQFVAGIRGARK